MEKNLEMCQCGHEQKEHNFPVGEYVACCALRGCSCTGFRPAPSQEKWDSKEGQTHYENDGCGEPEHNAPSQHSRTGADVYLEAAREIRKTLQTLTTLLNEE